MQRTLSERNALRDRIQEHVAVKGLRFLNVILSWATGVGKTRAAIRRAIALGGRWLIMCDEVANKQTWKQEIIDAGYTDYMYMFDIICYQSSKKYAGKSYNGLILDEWDLALTTLRTKNINNINHVFKTLCSATVEKEELTKANKLLNINKSNTWHWSISTSKAIHEGILPEPVIHVVNTYLDNTTPDLTFIKERKDKGKIFKEFTCIYKDRFRYLKGLKGKKGWSLKIMCTESEYYDMLTADVDYWKGVHIETNQPWTLTKWKKAGRIRKDFISQSKTRWMKEVVIALNELNKRYVCFCGSQEQAKALGGDFSIYSDLKPKSIVRKRIAAFNNFEQSAIFPIKMLRRGANMRHLDVAVVGQLDKQQRSWIQMLGRSFRAEHPHVFLFVAQNTVDTDYFTEALKNLDKKYLRQWMNDYSVLSRSA